MALTYPNSEKNNAEWKQNSVTNKKSNNPQNFQFHWNILVMLFRAC